MALGAHVAPARRKWSAIGEQVKLQLDSPPLTPPRLRGVRRGLAVVVRGSPPVVMVQGVDPGFTLGRDSAMARSIKPDIEIGHAGFDEMIRVEGDRDLALAILHSGTRQQILGITEGVEVRGGRMEVRIDDIEELSATLSRILYLAELLERPALHEVPARLADHALKDPSLGFRLQAFRHLAAEFHGTDEVHATAQALLDAAHDELRLEASQVLLRRDAADGRQRAAKNLAEMATKRQAEPWIRRVSLEWLAQSQEADVAAHVARRILLRRDELPAMRRASLQALARAGAWNELLSFEHSDDPKELEALATGLGESGEVRAQPRLLKLLEFPKVIVSLAAAKSLGAVGDVHAIPALRRATEAKGLFKTPVGGAAEEAIRRIQERLGGSQAGEISLVVPSPLEGAVSAVDEGGVGPSRNRRGGEVSLA